MDSETPAATDSHRINSTVPKFNTIKLDLKAMSNNPDDVHLHNQHNPRIEPLHSRRSMEETTDPEQGRARGFERDSQYVGHHHSQQGGPYSGFTPLDTRSPSPLSSPARRRFGSGEPLHKTHGLGDSHDGRNLNPNGESPTQPERAPSPYYEMSRTGYSSHFVPMGEEIKDKEGRRDELDDDEVARVKKQQKLDTHRPGHIQSSHPPCSRHGSDMSLDDDGNPIHDRRHLMEDDDDDGDDDEDDDDEEEDDEEGHGRYNGQQHHHYQPQHIKTHLRQSMSKSHWKQRAM
ncbi:hypothetical protein BGZ67_004978 [Mortierella alpina]|nr:hypothetical protein BGZ67_004978 [Mortierella alpina]